jgi:hypothetical protein
MYAATSVFRTVDGPCAAYSLAPSHVPGTYELRKPVVIISGDVLHTVHRVVVHEPHNMVVIETLRGWCACGEEAFPADVKVESHVGFSRMVAVKKQLLTDRQVALDALMAAVSLSGHSYKVIDEYFSNMRFFELTVQPMSPTLYRNCGLPVRDWSQYTDSQLLLWLYVCICTLTRMRRFIGSNRKKDRKFGEPLYFLYLQNNHWRDMFIMLMNAFGTGMNVSYTRERTTITFRQTELSAFLRAVFEKYPEPPIVEPRLLTTMSAPMSFRLRENGSVIFDENVDTLRIAHVENLQGKCFPALLRAVSFPEKDDIFLEHNMLQVIANE